MTSKSLIMIIIAAVVVIAACGAAYVVLSDDSPGDDAPNQGGPGEDTPGEDTPGEDTPGEDTPGEDTPGEDTPGEDTPGEDTPGDGDETLVLAVNDSFSYRSVDAYGDGTTYTYTIIEVLGDDRYIVRSASQDDGSEAEYDDSEMTYDEYISEMYAAYLIDEDMYERVGLVTLDKGTNYDGRECVLWRYANDYTTIQIWVDSESDVFYLSEDVTSMDGVTYTQSMTLVSCTFIDKL